jgi:asparaginyl-tRNA synthetase
MEHLRDSVHFRPRTQTIASALRIRSEASFIIHDFFRKEGNFYPGFYYINTPVITGNDCEGAGELFELKNAEDFFGKKAYLTVSGQLHAEIFALALGKVYTFGPTFRAEKSHTQRHLAEFWMV